MFIVNHINIGEKLSKKDFQIRLEKLQFTLPIITDPKAREWLTEALNLMEIVTAEREELKKENQQLKDEVNRLKGEQGKPNIKGGKKISLEIILLRKSVKIREIVKTIIKEQMRKIHEIVNPN